MKIKYLFVLPVLLIIFTAITALFWHTEFVYSLPTRVPVNYRNISQGKIIPIPGLVGAKTHKPVFLHFFNPDCPCSKFNISHFKKLLNRYGTEATFAIVVITDKSYTPEQIQKRFKVIIPVLFDTSLAKLCGVYSTPQAVIIDADQRLYYRGNYNRSRYCTNKNSNYAQQALDSLLVGNHAVSFDQFALKAYGCQLPGYLKRPDNAE